MQTDSTRLPTLKLMVGLQRGLSMALRQHTAELCDENRALRAEAKTTMRHAAALRRRSAAASGAGSPAAHGDRLDP